MDHDFEKMYGQAVGQGAQATVYAKGDYAVKLYREGYPKINVFSEAYIMANLERDGFPSPGVYEVMQAGERFGLRMDIVKGRPMEDIVSEAGTDAEKHKNLLDDLVNLQCRLQKQGSSYNWLPDIKTRLRNDLVRSARLSDSCRERLLNTLDSLPDGEELCHCDFHFGNIFFDGTEYTIIDLLQMSKGDPAVDAVCSYVSYSFLDREYAELYLERYCDVSGISREHVLRWLPVYAGTLLGQVPEKYTPIVTEFINAGGQLL